MGRLQHPNAQEKYFIPLIPIVMAVLSILHWDGGSFPNLGSWSILTKHVPDKIRSSPVMWLSNLNVKVQPCFTPVSSSPTDLLTLVIINLGLYISATGAQWRYLSGFVHLLIFPGLQDLFSILVVSVEVLLLKSPTFK